MGSWDLDPSGPRCVDDKGEAGTHGHLSSIKGTFRHEHPSHDRLDSSFCGFLSLATDQTLLLFCVFIRSAYTCQGDWPLYVYLSLSLSLSLSDDDDLYSIVII